jgi:MFS family permease
MSKLPITSALYELDPAPRQFLLFIVFNVVSWQCLIGTVAVLFARKIEMPPSWVGSLIAFTSISMILVVATGLLVMHWGSKRVMFIGWFLRNLFACVVFIMPWAMARWGARAAWYVLMASTLGFCLMRALGAGGWFPWLHEVVPENQRGAYFSAEASITQLLSIVLALVQALILHGDPGVNRYLVVYGIGIAAGFMSLLWMYRIPGGRAVQEHASLKTDFASYQRAWADKPFISFILVGALCYSMVSWLGSSYVMFMRDALLISSRNIMVITAFISVSVMLTIRYWARFAERQGSARAIALAQTGHAACGLACLTLVPGTSWALYGIVPIIVLASVCGSAFWMTMNRAMLGYVKKADRVSYTNLWQVVTAVTLGVIPVLVGLVIDHWGLWGFRCCFLMAGLGGLGTAALIRRTAHEGGTVHVPHGFREWVVFPCKVMGQIARVTMGLDESNR